MTTEEEVDAFLAHYGVKGMKWGVRKSSRQRAAAKAKRKKTRKKVSKSVGKFVGKHPQLVGTVALLGTGYIYATVKDRKISRIMREEAVQRAGEDFALNRIVNNKRLTSDLKRLDDIIKNR